MHGLASFSAKQTSSRLANAGLVHRNHKSFAINILFFFSFLFLWAEGLRQGTMLREGTGFCFLKYCCLKKFLEGILHPNPIGFVKILLFLASDSLCKPGPSAHSRESLIGIVYVAHITLMAATVQGQSCPRVPSSLMLQRFLRARHISCWRSLPLLHAAREWLYGWGLS